MRDIVNIIDEVYDGKFRQTDWDKRTGIAVHRAGYNRKTNQVIGWDGLSIARAFTGKDPNWEEVAAATGRQNPYTIYIGGDQGPSEFDGVVWQALPISEVGYHARRFSGAYIGVCCIGDFRSGVPMSRKQHNALVDICAEFCAAFLWDPYSRIKGHGEIPGAASPAKRYGASDACPGFKMHPIRYDVAEIMKNEARQRLFERGLQFGRNG